MNDPRQPALFKRRQQDLNREHGKFWEDAFKKIAEAQGCWARRNLLTARFLGKGKILPVKSQLDYTLVRRADGRCAWADCKAFDGGSFAYSALSYSQRADAFALCEAHVPAGFAVYFWERGVVRWYSGTLVESRAGTSLTCTEGELLGRFSGAETSVSLSPIWL